MRAFLFINSLFKTTEYKIDSSNNLDISELSPWGLRSRTISLSSLETFESQSKRTYLAWGAPLLGIFTIVTLFLLKNQIALIGENLWNFTAFTLCASGALFLICKPVKSHIYRDMYSNNVLFKLLDDSSNNSATKTFIRDLNTAILKAKEVELNRINLKPNAKKDYDLHSENVDSLFNSGLIDEALYNRICDSMYENVFGRREDRYTVSNSNVIYLNQ